MADLVQANEEEDDDIELDEVEIQILKKAKILSDEAGSRGKKRKHVLFAENVDEGMFCPYLWLFASDMGMQCPDLPKEAKKKKFTLLPQRRRALRRRLTLVG